MGEGIVTFIFMLSVNLLEEEIMPFCPKCGKEVYPEVTYCSSCGERLKESKDLLHEKIAEARHNRIMGAITALLGLVMSLAAIFLKLQGAPAYDLLNVFGTITWLTGLIIMLYYAYQREKLMKQLE